MNQSGGLFSSRGEAGLARASDPGTSHIAAAMVATNRTPSQSVVWDIMRDGLGRTDEMIAADAATMGCNLSPTRLRHGRNELVAQGKLAVTTARWKTRRLRPSRVYIRADLVVKFNGRNSK